MYTDDTVKRFQVCCERGLFTYPYLTPQNTQTLLQTHPKSFAPSHPNTIQTTNKPKLV